MTERTIPINMYSEGSLRGIYEEGRRILTDADKNWSTAGVLPFIVGDDLQVVLGLHRLEDLWGPISGKRESVDYTPEDTAIRELMEEAGVRCSPDSLEPPAKLVLCYIDPFRNVRIRVRLLFPIEIDYKKYKEFRPGDELVKIRAFNLEEIQKLKDEELIRREPLNTPWLDVLLDLNKDCRTGFIPSAKDLPPYLSMIRSVEVYFTMIQHRVNNN